MRTSLNFDDWLEANGPIRIGDYSDISYAIRHLCDTDYRYSAWRRGGKVFVRGPVSVLVLASDAAVRAFLRLVDRLHRMDEIDVEGLIEELRAFEEQYC
jgi:hypothetical protein